MVQIKNRFDISSEVLKKIACANVADSVDAAAVRDLEFVGVTNRRYCVLKRMMDMILALVALFIIAIPMLIVFLIVYIDDPGNVLFVQYRIGLGGRRGCHPDSRNPL